MKPFGSIGYRQKCWLHCGLSCVLIMSIAACSGSGSGNDVADDPPPEGSSGNSSPHRNFEYPFYEPQNCPEDPIYNCTADLTLCEDGSAYMLITDIINGGSYTENGATIVSNWGIGDVPPQIVFTVSTDGTMTDDVFGLTWDPVAESSFDSLCSP